MRSGQHRRNRKAKRSAHLNKRRRQRRADLLERRELLTTFFVDDDGVAGGNGSFNNPFPTIQAAANAAQAGDVIEIRAGVYREQVNLPRSGTQANPITFRAYQGEEVVVSGADLVTGWTAVPGRTDAWVATANWNANNNRDANTLFVNGELRLEARDQAEIDPIRIDDWGQVPQGSLTSTTLRSPDLVGRGNDFWNGARIHFHTNDFTITTRTIADYNSATGTVTFDRPVGIVTQKQTTGYYIDDTIDTLDRPGEWYKGKFSDGSGEQNRLYYQAQPGEDPNSLDIEFKRRAFGFDARSRDHIHLEGIEFRGVSILTNSSTDSNVYRGNTFYAYDRGQFGRFIITGDNNVFRDNVVRELWSGVLTYGGTGNQFINNQVTEIGYAGVSKVLNLAGAEELLVSHNTFRTFSEAFIDAYPVRSEIAYNVFEDGGTLTWDTGVFDADGANGNSSYSIVHHNIFRDTSSRGIYEAFYGANNNLVIHHNLIYDFTTQTVTRPAFSTVGTDFRQAYHNTIITTADRAPLGSTTARNAVQTRYNNNVQITTANIEAIGVDLRGNHDYSPSDFVDFAGQDFRLSAGSEAIDTGIVIPGVNDDFLGDAPDAGAFEFGGADWTLEAGHNFETPPNPVYSWQALPNTNIYPNGQFLQGIGDWTVVSGTPNSADRNSWNLQASLGSLTGSPRTRSVEFTPGEAIQRTFTGLQPDTVYTVGSAVRLANEITAPSQFASSSGSIRTGVHRELSYVTDLSAGEWVRYSNIDFGDAGQYDEIDLLSIRDPSTGFPENLSGVGVEVRLDSANGPLLARYDQVTFGVTQDRWRADRAELLTEVSGVRDIYVSVTGASSRNLAVGSFRLLSDAPTASDLLTVTASSFGAPTVVAGIGNRDWKRNYETVSFKTGPSANSATIEFGNSGRLNAYVDRLFLIEDYATRGAIPRDVSSGAAAAVSLSPTTQGPAPELTDGDPSTIVFTGDHADSWIQVDLGRSTPLHSIQLVPLNGLENRASNFRLSVWNNDPANGGVELWGQDYFTDGESLSAGENLVVHNSNYNHDETAQLGSISGRFIRVESLGPNPAGDQLLALSELKVLGFDHDNLALTDGIATQSTTELGLPAGAANDDNPATRSSTAADDFDSWWQVRFAQTSSIGSIELTNHEAAAAGELGNFTVSVWTDEPEDGGVKVWEKAFFEQEALGAGDRFVIDGSEAGDGTTLRLASVHTGRVVRVQLNGVNNAGNGRLSLADLAVYGGDSRSPSSNLARTGVASQRDNFYGDRNSFGFASDATNGVINTLADFTTATSSQGAWWQVELEGQSDIEQIVLYNRTAVPFRLNNFDVSVWDGDPDAGGVELWNSNYRYSSGAGEYSFGSFIGPGGALVIDGSDTDGGLRLDAVQDARYVRVRQNDTNLQSLVEVQVWGVSNNTAEVDLNQLVYNYDPGSDSAVFAGAESVAPDLVGDISWTGQVSVTDRGPSTGLNNYNRDFIGGATPAVFNHRIANGRYRVTLNMSDPLTALDNQYVAAEGVRLLSNIDRLANQRITFDVEVDVTDGELNLEFGDDDTVNPAWAVNRILLTRIPSSGPIIAPGGGVVDSGTEALITNTDTVGGVYATTDGSDPRLPNGSINPSAIPIGAGVVTTEVLLEDFDSVAAPEFPAGWDAQTTNPGSTWTTSNARGDGPGAAATVNDFSQTSDATLTSPSFSVDTNSARIKFRNSFDVEDFYDGGALEISIGGGPFQDILDAGGSFLEGGYNLTLFSNGQALGGRAAWSGDSGGFIDTTVDLPTASFGQDVRLRWRFASDGSVGGDAWSIDSLRQVVTSLSPPSITLTEDATLTARSLIGDQWSDATTAQFRIGLAGDYNEDGQVNLADYTVWRDAFGENVPNASGADGNGDGVVDLQDYEVWIDNSGRTAAQPAQTPAPVAVAAPVASSFLVSPAHEPSITAEFVAKASVAEPQAQAVTPAPVEQAVAFPLVTQVEGDQADRTTAPVASSEAPVDDLLLLALAESGSQADDDREIAFATFGDDSGDPETETEWLL